MTQIKFKNGSGMIYKMFYCADSKTLTVQFRKSDKYRYVYHGIPETIVSIIKTADSAGKMFRETVLNTDVPFTKEAI